MRVSPAGFSTAFKSNGDCPDSGTKSSFNPVTATGYLALGSFGGAMISGIEKKMKIHRAFCYASLAFAVSHLALLNVHKHSKHQLDSKC